MFFRSNNYNSEKNIAKTIESVLCQSSDEYEYIVIDGDSKDTTLDVVKSYESRFASRMKWISESDFGIYDAMNKGINFARGDWLIFINCGDVFFDNNSLYDLFQFIEINNIEEVLIYGNVATINEENVIVKIIKYPNNKISKRFLMEDMICLFRFVLT